MLKYKYDTYVVYTHKIRNFLEGRMHKNIQDLTFEQKRNLLLSDNVFQFIASHNLFKLSKHEMYHSLESNQVDNVLSIIAEQKNDELIKIVTDKLIKDFPNGVRTIHMNHRKKVTIGEETYVSLIKYLKEYKEYVVIKLSNDYLETYDEAVSFLSKVQYDALLIPKNYDKKNELLQYLNYKGLVFLYDENHVRTLSLHSEVESIEVSKDTKIETQNAIDESEVEKADQVQVTSEVEEKTESIPSDEKIDLLIGLFFDFCKFFEIKEEKNQKTSKPRRQLSNWKLVLAYFILFIMDAFFIVSMLQSTSPYLYLVFVVLGILNVIALILLRDFISTNNKKRRSHPKMFEQFVDKLKVFKPIKEEVYTIQSEEVIEEVLHFDEVEDVQIEILKPKEVIHQKPTYNEQVHLNHYANELYTYLMDSGLKVERSIIREILAGFAASKLIIIKHPSSNVSERFIELVTDFIGAKLTIDRENPEWKSIQDVAFNSSINEVIDNANAHKQAMHVYALKRVNLLNLTNYFNEIIDYAYHPNINKIIEQGNLSKREIPINAWFIVLPRNIKNLPPMKQLHEAAITINLHADVVEPKTTMYENKLKLSYHEFTRHVRDCEDAFYIEEEYWKKIDHIERYINEHKPFKIDNRMMRQMEKFSSMYILMGGEQNEAVDTILNDKILEMVEPMKLHRINENDEGIFAVAEKEFGLENLVRSKVVLKRIEDNYNGK